MRKVLPGGVTLAALVALLSPWQSQLLQLWNLVRGGLASLAPRILDFIITQPLIEGSGLLLAFAIAFFIVGLIQREYGLGKIAQLATEVDTWKAALKACLGELELVHDGETTIRTFSLKQFEASLRCQLIAATSTRQSNEERLPADAAIKSWYEFRHPGVGDDVVREGAAVALSNFEMWTWIKKCRGEGFDYYYKTSRRFVAQSPVTITSVNPSTGKAGDTVVVKGANFGERGPASSVTLDGALAAVPAGAWSDAMITLLIPDVAPSGAPWQDGQQVALKVVADGQSSMDAPFRIVVPKT